MRYLDEHALSGMSVPEFRSADPYPHAELPLTLTPEGYRAMVEKLPPLRLFKKQFGVVRKNGQYPHDRYVLHYRPFDPRIPRPWHDFAREIRGPGYRAFLERVFDYENPELELHWHYATEGCSVSPHCDSVRKLGSHIFYLNRESDWNPKWGGGTLVMRDRTGAWKTSSAPSFDDLETVYTSRSVGNSSFMFGRTPNSWHGVLPLTCPPDAMRRVFIVTINKRRPGARKGWWRLLNPLPARRPEA
jgi:hypothetical protein